MQIPGKYVSPQDDRIELWQSGARDCYGPERFVRLRSRPLVSDHLYKVRCRFASLAMAIYLE